MMIKGIYHLVMTNIANWKDPPCLIGKPSISMGHGFHGELLNNQRGKFQEWMNRNEQNIMELYQPLNTCSTSDSFQVRKLKELTIIS